MTPVPPAFFVDAASFWSKSVRVEAMVTRTEGELAWVKVVQEGGGCGRCEEPGGCRSAMLGDALGVRCREYAVANTLQAVQGVRVAVDVPDGVPLRAAGWAYGFPLLGLLLGAAVARACGAGDASMALGAALGVCAAVGFARWRARKIDVNSMRPQLVAILDR